MATIAKGVPSAKRVLSFVSIILVVVSVMSIVMGVYFLVFREWREITALQASATQLITGAINQAGEGDQKIPLGDAAKLIEAIVKLLLLKTGPAAFLSLFGLTSFGVGSWVFIKVN